MNYKYTADGKKVAVIGKLNSEETIVQEIYVNDGTEFPAGEHFVVKTLLDVPAETYQSIAEKNIEARIKKLQAEEKKYIDDIKKIKEEVKEYATKMSWIRGIKQPEIKEVFDNIKAIINNEYTHIVLTSYNIEIKEWGNNVFPDFDRYGNFESLRLISLYGYWRKRLELGWKVSRYPDGSGSSETFIPCKSLEEAVSTAKELIYKRDELSKDDYNLCVEYNIPIEEEKNKKRIEQEAASIKKNIEVKEKEIERLKNILNSIN